MDTRILTIYFSAWKNVARYLLLAALREIRLLIYQYALSHGKLWEDQIDVHLWNSMRTTVTVLKKIQVKGSWSDTCRSLEADFIAADPHCYT